MTRVTILLVSILLGAGCLVPNRPGPAPLIGRQLLLGDPQGPHVILEGTWRREGHRFCNSGGTVDVLTPAGPVGLHDAALCATPWPAAIEGEARVPLPGLGFLAGLITGAPGPRARLSVALGRELGTLIIGDQRFPAEPDYYYLLVEHGGRHDVELGRGRLTVGERMILDPHVPVFYFGGDLAGLLPAAMRGVVFGLSPTGGVPYTSAHALHDGHSSAVRQLTGHLFIQGTMPLGDYPVTATGRVVVDLDADDDGRTVFVDEGEDVALGGDVIVRLGYSAAGFDLRLELARASFVRQGGVLYLGASAPGTLLAGTVLGAFAPQGDLTVMATYRSVADFVVVVRGAGQIGGLPLSSAEILFGTGGVSLSGRLDLGAFGPVDVAGAVLSDGTYALGARSELRVAGLPLSDVAVAVSSKGLQVSAKVRLAGTSFVVTGIVEPGREISLRGMVPLSAGPILGRAVISIGAGGLTVLFQGRVCKGVACIELPETSVDAQGRVCPSFPIIGRHCVQVL